MCCNGKAHEPIILKAATSFTSMSNCVDNFAIEAETHDFDSMMEHLAQQWIERLHSIDVEDPDTARVNQFYGALYRCSFLPREMSDAGGDYPKFADGTILSPLTIPEQSSPTRSLSHHSPQKYYGDFSMWDTYRAVHPLYNRGTRGASGVIEIRTDAIKSKKRRRK